LVLGFAALNPTYPRDAIAFGEASGDFVLGFTALNPTYPRDAIAWT